MSGESERLTSARKASCATLCKISDRDEVKMYPYNIPVDLGTEPSDL